MSIADKLQELIDSKADMKSAIAEKGVEVEGGLVTYADAIRQIQQGSGEGSDIDWSGVRFGGSKRFPLPPEELYKCGNMDYMFTGCDFENDLEFARKLGEIGGAFATSLRGCFQNVNVYWTEFSLWLDWDTSNVTDLSCCFKNSDLCFMRFVDGEVLYDYFGKVDDWDTSNVTNFEECFATDMIYGLLLSIPNWDFSKATNVGRMLDGQLRLHSIPRINLGSLSAGSGWMLTTYCWEPDDDGSKRGYLVDYKVLTDIGGFVDLKLSIPSNFINHCPSLTVESLTNIIRDIYDWNTNPENLNISDYTHNTIYDYVVLNFGEVNLNKLTDEQIAVAIAKGWTLI